MSEAFSQLDHGFPAGGKIEALKKLWRY